MSYNYFYKQLNQKARTLFPGLKELPELAWEYLISPLEIRLPKSVLSDATAAIEALYSLTRAPAYASLLENQPGVSEVQTAHKSVLMAYDFHTTEDGRCHLVEVNTNASGFMLSSLMEMTHRQETAAEYAPLQLLRESFIEELELFGRPSVAGHVAITDEDIPTQKMYPEFVMYRDWFKTFGWSAEFCDGKDFLVSERGLTSASGAHVDLVYNRSTDFYFEEPQNLALHQAFINQLACITPNPREYWLLANKERLIQWGRPEFWQAAGASSEQIAAIERVLIPTFDKSAFASEEAIWAERKHLFFKPKRSFGGKSVYRGESVSRKVFERLMQEDILIQRFQPAQRMPTEDPRSVLTNWKFDLRLFVYGNQVQMAAARIYQGQVTNFSSPMGGFTFVRF